MLGNTNMGRIVITETDVQLPELSYQWLLPLQQMPIGETLTAGHNFPHVGCDKSLLTKLGSTPIYIARHG